MAFRHVGHRYKHKLIAGLKPHEVEKALQLADELSHELGYSGSHNDGLLIASVVLASLNKYLYSPDLELQEKHVHENYKRLEKILNGVGGWTRIRSNNCSSSRPKDYGRK
ncbi:MAG: hypothetical protein Q8S52_05710 [Methylobacter sp.]|nr:hypothetical protein [Methylobacter sp.]